MMALTDGEKAMVKRFDDTTVSTDTHIDRIHI